MNPKAVVAAIENLVGVTGRPVQLRDAIERVHLDAKFDPATAAEQSEMLLQPVLKEIKQRQRLKAETGEVSVLSLRPDSDQLVFGSSYVFGDDSVEVKQAKHNRVSVDAIHSVIQELSFSDFENFGRAILLELGCSHARVTPHAGDQGIDFYGHVSIGGILGIDPMLARLMHETRVVIVGQAKHYPKFSLGPAVIRELVGALSLSRTYTYSRDDIDLLDGVELRPFSPLLAVIFSTGSFTKGARNLSKRAGLIAFSGRQLAVFLADKGVGFVEVGGRKEFSGDAFRAWLNRAEVK